VQKQLDEYEKKLKQDGDKIIIDEIKHKMKKAELAQQDYEEAMNSTDFYNVADLIVENKLLMDKVDALFGKPDKSVTSKSLKTHKSSLVADQIE